MIEIKGINLPVVLIKIKERGDLDTLSRKIKEKLSSKLFYNSYFLIDGKECLTEDELKKLEESLSDKMQSVRTLQSEKPQIKSRLLVVRKHLRSGQKIEHNGDILVLGDVNKDAQVVASGNIIVMGKLRGIAFAGALGDESCVVVALEMLPQQIRIGKKVAIMSDEDRKPLGSPELAKVENGIIILEQI